MTARRLAVAALATAALALGLRAGAAHAAPPPRVAVVIGESFGVEPAAADALGAALATALAKRLVVDAVGGGDVSRRLPPAGLPDECLSTPACVADLGGRLDADRLLVLVLIRAGAEIQVDASEIVVATGASTPRPRTQIADPTAAEAAFAEAAGRYLPDAAPRAAGTTIVLGGARRPIKPVVWIVGGTGLAALAGAGILGLTIKSKYDGCSDADNPCSQGKRDSIHRRTVIADAVLGVGLAAVATAIVIYARTPTRSSEIQPSVAPVAGGAVVGLGGRF